MPTLQEKLQEMEKDYSRADLLEAMADPNCEIRLPDGGTLPPALIESGKDQLLEYLAGKFPEKGSRSLLLIDKSAPDAPPHAVSFSEDGFSDFGVVRSAGEFAARWATPRLRAPKKPTEPKKPTWGSYVKEFFSFLTGGSRTLREYREYEKKRDDFAQTRAEYDSRVYDAAKKAGFPNLVKPEKYVEAPEPQPQPEPADHGKDFRAFCGSERERLTQKIMDRVKKAEAFGKSSLTEGLKLGLDYETEKGSFSDKTLRVLASLSSGEFSRLQSALDQKETNVKNKGISPEMVPDLLEHYAGTELRENFVGVIGRDTRYLEPEELQRLFRQKHPVGELGPQHKEKRIELLRSEYREKINRRLEKLELKSKLGEVLREKMGEGSQKGPLNDDVLRVLANDDEDTFQRFDELLSRRGGYKKRHILYFLKCAETPPEKKEKTLFDLCGLARMYYPDELDRDVFRDKQQEMLRERLRDLAPQSKLAAGLEGEKINDLDFLTLRVLNEIEPEKFRKVVAAVEEHEVSVNHVAYALSHLPNGFSQENVETGKKEIESSVERQLRVFGLTDKPAGRVPEKS